MSGARDSGDDPAAALSAIEVRTLVAVVLDLADDLGFDCAVVVVDRAGALRGAERPGAVPVGHLDAALEAAHAALRDGGGEAGGAAAAAVVLADGAVRGAVAVSGGPDGFAL
ncbi:MAG TPA: hypothetical protein VL422_12145, partial [Miltoncostaea sp.]|nr:hypothetical protein [Miltoncostaea sp.]